MFNNPERARQRLVDRVFDRFGYEEKVLRRGIKVNKLPANPVVYDLAAGNCEDVVFLRKIFGRLSQIYAFDIKMPTDPISEVGIYFSDAFIETDIRNIDQCIEVAGGSVPDLIVSRHPRVIENVHGSGPVEFNPWWGDTLVEWAQRLPEHGQMFMTCYTQMERDFLSAHFARYGMQGLSMDMDYTPMKLRQYNVFENPLVPVLPPEYAFNSSSIGRARMDSIPDGFTLLIQK